MTEAHNPHDSWHIYMDARGSAHPPGSSPGLALGGILAGLAPARLRQ
jgi:hypothetical protein